MTDHENRFSHLDLFQIGKNESIEKETDRVKNRDDRRADQEDREIVVASLGNLFVPGQTNHFEVIVEIEEKVHFARLLAGRPLVLNPDLSRNPIEEG